MANNLQTDEAYSTRRQRELDLLGSLRRPSYYPYRPVGVLLSDWIRFYIENYDLIVPFEEKQLKRAGYELSVGSIYSVAGKTHELLDEPGKNELRIEPFEVAIIQTRERVNMPDFLIGRWNIRVRHAYEGLLWVGGPQVDPGYQGFLFCPIYNLSDQPVTLHFGEELALIDFVTTTPPTRWSKPYPTPGSRSRLLFEDYRPNGLQSALATRAERRITQFASTIEQVRSRFDNYSQITFAILALLFAGIALAFGKPQDFSLLNPTLILSATAIFAAVSAFHYAKSESEFLTNVTAHRKETARRRRTLLEVLITALIFAGALWAFYGEVLRPMNDTIRQLSIEVQRLQAQRPSKAESSTSEDRRAPARSADQKQ